MGVSPEKCEYAPRSAGTNARDVLIVTSVMLAGSFLLPSPDRAGQILRLPSPCLFYHMTGLPCPACGLTRSFVCIAHGQLSQAVVWHPLGPVLFAAALFYWLDALSRTKRGRPLFPGRERLQRKAGAWGLAAALIFGFARMAFYAASHAHF
jgi:hypothetical protein